MNTTDQPGPEGGMTEVPAPAPPAPPEPPMPPAPKPRIDVLFLVLGILTPYAIVGVALGLGALFNDQGGVSIAIVTFALQGLFFVFLGLWIWGKSKALNRLRSYGVGGMWSYAVVPLLMLVLFGTCLMGVLPA